MASSLWHVTQDSFEPQRQHHHETIFTLGNGYLSTGLMDTLSATPFPNKQTITFSTPGTYVYYCNIHEPDMKGTIVVQ